MLSFLLGGLEQDPQLLRAFYYGRVECKAMLAASQRIRLRVAFWIFREIQIADRMSAVPERF